MNRIKVFILSIITIIAINTWAYDIEVDGIYYNINIKDKSAIVTKGDTTYVGNIKIPSTITYANHTIPVGAIGNQVFEDCSSLTSIEIPNSVSKIGSYAFRGCSNLTSIKIPNSVTKIEGYAFSGCSSLTSIEIPNSVTEIGKNAFKDCSSLTSIKIPNSVTEIGDNAFSGCSSLTSIKISNSVSTINKWVFSGCSSLTSIKIPNSVTTIDEEAFEGCSSLTKFIIEDGKKEIFIYISSFGSQDSIEYLYIGRNLSIVGRFLFSNLYLSNLNKVTISKYVDKINHLEWSGIKNLKVINCYNPEPPNLIVKNNFTNSQYLNVIVNIPKGSITAYQSADIWESFWNINVLKVAELKDY